MDLIQTDPTGESRLRELREARGRLYHLALDAREDGDADLERKIVRDIVSAIVTDVELCRSLGLTVDAAGQVPTPEPKDKVTSTPNVNVRWALQMSRFE